VRSISSRHLISTPSLTGRRCYGSPGGPWLVGTRKLLERNGIRPGWTAMLSAATRRPRRRYTWRRCLMLGPHRVADLIRRLPQLPLRAPRSRHPRPAPQGDSRATAEAWPTRRLDRFSQSVTSDKAAEVKRPSRKAVRRSHGGGHGVNDAPAPGGGGGGRGGAGLAASSRWNCDLCGNDVADLDGWRDSQEYTRRTSPTRSCSPCGAAQDQANLFLGGDLQPVSDLSPLPRRRTFCIPSLGILLNRHGRRSR